MKKMLMKILLGILGAILLLFSVIWFPGEGTQTIKGDNSIAEFRKVELGGIEQSILIRGNDKDNPILLKLHGGPGSPVMLTVEKDQELEKEFIVVNWDQRGAGKSYSSDIPVESMTFEQLTSDTHELTQYLKKEFDKEKIYIMGISAGTVLALNEVAQHPEDYYANIAVSQVVHTKENFQLAIDFVLESAKKQGNDEDVTAIEELRTKSFEEFANLQSLGGLLAKYQKASEETQAPLTVFFAREYTGMDFVRYFKGMQFSMENMYKELLQIDMTSQVQEIEVPMYVFSGKHDIQASPALAKEYFDTLKAPKKEFFVFDNSAHSPDLEENEKFTDLVINKIKKETYTLVQN